MAWLIIPFIIAVFIGKTILENTMGIAAKLCLLLFFDIILLGSILFKHYLGNNLWIFGEIISVLLLLINLILSLLFIAKYKRRIILLKLFVPIVSMILYLNNIDDTIALKIELIRAKNKLEKITRNNYNNYEMKDISIDSGLYAFRYYSGMVDNWIGIIYDNSGLLENGIVILNNNDNYLELEEYSKIKKLFGGDLYSIKKLEENWYICHFT